MHSRRPRADLSTRLSVVGLVLSLLSGIAFTMLATPAVATSYGGAVSSAWPDSWRTYKFADGTPVGDTNSDQTPPYLDLVSGTCSSCVGPEPSVMLATDGVSAFFRMRMGVDNNDAGKGGLFGGAFLVQLADVNGNVRAVVGVDGKQSGNDYVYVTNAVGGSTQMVYENPFSTANSSAGMRWIAAGDGTSQFFLDFQVPMSVIEAVSGGAITGATPIKLYYGSSAAANLATINKDLMVAGATAVSFSNLSVVKLNPATYSVTFDSDGGSAVSAASVADGDPVANPGTPTRAGYTFTGWYDGTTPWDFTSPVTRALQLTAHWSRNSYTVNFDANGGTPVAAASVAGADPVGEPSDPTRSGYTFAGWYDGADPWDFSTPVTGTLQLTAHWDVATYRVTFAPDGGSTTADQLVAHGTPVTEPTDPTRSGYTFAGWYDGADRWDFSTPVTGTLQLTAHWELLLQRDLRPGRRVQTADSAASVADGSPGSRTGRPDPHRLHLRRLVRRHRPWDFTAPVTTALQLTAHWSKNPYTVTFDADGGSAVSAASVVDGDPVAKPADPTRTGYAFTGWYDGADSWDFTTPVTSTLQLTAHWSNNPRTVTFDRNDGTAVQTTFVADGDPVAKPVDPTRAGYTFAGWYDGTDSWDFTTPVTTDLQLSAHWTVANYRVTFDADGGSATADQLVTPGNPSPSRPTPPEPATPSPAGTTAPTPGTSPHRSPAHLQLTAHWTVATYTVTFDADGGSATADQLVAPGDPVTEPATPTRPGYTFTGWYDGTDCLGLHHARHRSDLQLTAHWTCHLPGDLRLRRRRPPPPTSSSPRRPVTKPATPTRPATPSPAGTTAPSAWDFTTPVTGALQLTAHWTVANYRVTFDADGGSPTPDQLVTPGTRSPSRPTPPDPATPSPAGTTAPTPGTSPPRSPERCS